MARKDIFLKILKNKFFGTLVGASILLLIWFALTFFYPEYLVPPIQRPFGLIFTEYDKFMYHIGYTLYRVVVGFSLAFLVSLPVGILAGLNRRANTLILSTINILFAIPAICWVLILMIIFGSTESSRFLLQVIVLSPIMIFSITEGIQNRDVRYDEMADVFGFSRWKKIRRVFLPYLFPYIIGSARSAFGVGVKLIIIAELIGTTVGAGLQLLYYYGMGMFVYVYSYAILLIAIYVVFDLIIFGAIERYATRWKR